jgi:hypothetical protein
VGESPGLLLTSRRLGPLDRVRDAGPTFASHPNLAIVTPAVQLAAAPVLLEKGVERGQHSGMGRDAITSESTRSPPARSRSSVLPRYWAPRSWPPGRARGHLTPVHTPRERTSPTEPERERADGCRAVRGGQPTDTPQQVDRAPRDPSGPDRRPPRTRSGKSRARLHLVTPATGPPRTAG